MGQGVRVGTAFVPVSDPEASAGWYAASLGLRVARVDAWAAQLGGDAGVTALTLMGPASGIKADPGLPFATCNFVVDDLEGTRARLVEQGDEPSPVDGSPDTCLFFTVADPDGNVLLVVDR